MVKINILGRQADIKTEIVIIASAALILLGCLTGYVFFRDASDIIIEHEGGETTADMGNITQNAVDMTVPANNIYTASNGEGKVPTGSGISAQAADAGKDAVNAAAELIKVYIVGCVKNPGIVILEKGQVIDDAVKKAGGLTDEADAAGINMVYELNENTMLYIKSKKEAEADRSVASDSGTAKASGLKPNAAKPSAQAAQAAQVHDATAKNAKSVNNPAGTTDEYASADPDAQNTGKGAAIIGGSGTGVEITPGGDRSGGAVSLAKNGGSAYININTADLAELDKLPGIGEATAREIIAYREKNGPFLKIEDIMKVPRIKQGRFDSIRDMITVN